MREAIDARVRYLLRARSGDRRRHHPGTGRTAQRRTGRARELLTSDITSMSHVTIGIIGGSGLYDMAELTDREERVVTTPFGDPSGPYVLATLRGRRVAFLARHGHGHRLLPSELNFRANIYGFKVLGVEWILSASAVGSLREDYKPLDLVVPDAVLRSHARAHQHVLRRRPRRARRLRAPVLHAAERRSRSTAGDAGRRDRAPRRHVRVHGRPAVLDRSPNRTRTARPASTSSA